MPMSTFRDHYFKMAKTEGYRARSAYKLIEANQKFRLIKGGDFILDLGAAPGSWLRLPLRLSAKKGLSWALILSRLGSSKNWIMSKPRSWMFLTLNLKKRFYHSVAESCLTSF